MPFYVKALSIQTNILMVSAQKAASREWKIMKLENYFLPSWSKFLLINKCDFHQKPKGFGNIKKEAHYQQLPSNISRFFKWWWILRKFYCKNFPSIMHSSSRYCFFSSHYSLWQMWKAKLLLVIQTPPTNCSKVCCWPTECPWQARSCGTQKFAMKICQNCFARMKIMRSQWKKKNPEVQLIPETTEKR